MPLPRRGRILAIKWGLNPNSSSLGVDVTFLLVGATALSIATPFVSALLRWRRPARIAADAAPIPTGDGPQPPSGEDPAGCARRGGGEGSQPPLCDAG
jgi:hypothetical protein